MRLWIMPNGPEPKDDIDRLLAPFDQKTGIKVEAEVVGWDVAVRPHPQRGGLGRGPGHHAGGHDAGAVLRRAQRLRGPVEPRRGHRRQGAPTPTASGRRPRSPARTATWSLPWFTEARAIYYRKDVLKKAGVDAATAFTDWDAFRATLQTIKDKVPEIDGKPIEPFGSPGKKAFDLVHHVMPFVWDAGGAELSDDNTKSTIDSPEAEQGVEFMADLLQKGLYDKSQLERDGTQVENQFKGGRIAVWIGGPWMLASAARADDENWVPAARKNVGDRADAGRPERQGLHVRRRLEPDDVQVVEEQGRGLGADEVPVPGRSSRPSTPSCSGCSRRGIEPQKPVGETDAELRSFYEAIQQGRTYAPIPQWGADRERVQGALRRTSSTSAAGRAASYSRAVTEGAATRPRRRPTPCWPRAAGLTLQPTVGASTAAPARPRPPP